MSVAEDHDRDVLTPQLSMRDPTPAVGDLKGRLEAEGAVLLVAALGTAVGAPVLLVAAVASLTVAFGIGQPAMILAVSGAVDSAQRGAALGVTTLLFLAGAGVGAAVVGGLGEVLGISGALSVLGALPVAGTLVMLRQLRTAARSDVETAREPVADEFSPASSSLMQTSPTGEETAMNLPQIVPSAEWETARVALLAREKEATRARDALAAQRRRLPMVQVDKHYTFEGPDGVVSLLDLFDGRRQLIVYHHMLKPGDDDPCSGCSMVVDNICDLAHLHARDTSLVVVSRAPSAEIEAFKKRMGWTIPWLSSAANDFDADFDADFGVTTSFGLNVFFRAGNEVFRSYFTSGRGVEALGSTWSFLDLTPLGRQEDWEDSPEGWPQTRPYEWWRLHDEY